MGVGQRQVVEWDMSESDRSKNSHQPAFDARVRHCVFSMFSRITIRANMACITQTEFVAAESLGEFN